MVVIFGFVFVIVLVIFFGYVFCSSLRIFRFLGVGRNVSYMFEQKQLEFKMVGMVGQYIYVFDLVMDYFVVSRFICIVFVLEYGCLCFVCYFCSVVFVKWVFECLVIDYFFDFVCDILVSLFD